MISESDLKTRFNIAWDSIKEAFKKGYDYPNYAKEGLFQFIKDILRDYEQEIVICAAVKTTTGKIFRCHRHSDGIQAIKDRHFSFSDKPEDEGFITSKNRYVTRSEGRKLQDKAGIKSVCPDGYCSNTLFSEDLY